jgi:hypothetical protein
MGAGRRCGATGHSRIGKRFSATNFARARKGCSLARKSTRARGRCKASRRSKTSRRSGATTRARRKSGRTRRKVLRRNATRIERTPQPRRRRPRREGHPTRRRSPRRPGGTCGSRSSIHRRTAPRLSRPGLTRRLESLRTSGHRLDLCRSSCLGRQDRPQPGAHVIGFPRLTHRPNVGPTAGSALQPLWTTWDCG